MVEPKEKILSQKVITKEHALVIYNDDVNTFEFVIESLIKVCKHEPIQAEQCTWLIHHKGNCTVKVGAFTALKSMCEALLERGITAKIEA